MLRLAILVTLFWSAAGWTVDEVDCRVQIAKLFENGIDRAQTVGYHGTSIGALEVALKTGLIPADRTGYLYFFPNPTHPRMQGPSPGFRLIPSAFGPSHLPFLGAEKYATTIADDHLILQKLNIPMTNKAITALALLHDTANLRGRARAKAFFAPYGYTLDQVDSVALNVIQNEPAGGIILGFHPTVFDRYKLSNADEGLRIRVPAGLPIQYLQGIEPLGQREYDYLEGLQGPP
jgi:hypothetical protein